MPTRSYTGRTLKLLWGRSGGRCAFPDCRIELLADATTYDPIVVIGEIAHMSAAQNRGPRADASLATAMRNDYDNLILLCQNCHALIDGRPGTYTVDKLQQLKADHELWVRTSLPERGRSLIGWTSLNLRGDHPPDLSTVAGALSPDFIAGDLQMLQVPGETNDWRVVDQTIAAHVAGVLLRADPFDFRLAVFPLAPVSACIALGFHLTSRPHIRLFQYHRDERTWAWPRLELPPQDISVEGLETGDSACRDVSFVFHLSAPISDATIEDTAAGPAHRVHFRVPEPGTGWLQHPGQLTSIAALTRQAFEQATQLFPNAERWHVFYAGPAPGAVGVGQQINPTMCPPVQRYEFRMRENPPYQASIYLGPG